MNRFALLPLLVAALLGGAASRASAQAPRDTTTNLKVLPVGTPREEVVRIMGTFTRALGVRCGYCHALEEGRPPDFASDAKPTKNKAREMMRMVKDLNDTYLAKLDHRADPPIKVECATCHRGVPQPRQLQDVLKMAYDTGGMDSTLARYHALRDRWYGRAAYDFGDVPLADLAGQLDHAGHSADALRLLQFNVEMNPASAFAKRQYAGGAIVAAFTGQGADSGAAVYRRMQAQYGPQVVPGNLLGEAARQMLGGGHPEAAIAALKLNVAENPSSAGALVGLGDAYAAQGDRKQALEAYTKAVALDPADPRAKQKLDALRAQPAEKKKR